MPKLFSYIRWSSSRQSEGTTLARQTAAAKAFAVEHDLEYDEIRDEGVSAFRGKNSKRGALADFIAAVEAGAIPSDSWLYVENLDRLSRDEAMRSNDLLRRLLSLGMTVVTGQDKRIHTPESEKDVMAMIFSILAFERANEESRTKQKRTVGNALALVERHKQGRPVNIKAVGSAPWWIDASGPQYEAVKPHPVHWVAAKKAVELFLRGWGAYRVVTYLNQHLELYPAPRGNKGPRQRVRSFWTIPTVKRLRLSRALIGEKVMTLSGSSYTLQNYYPPLCTEQEFARLNDIRENNRIKIGSERKTTTFLSGLGGLLRCGHCDTPMTYYTKEGRIRYVCAGGQQYVSTCRAWSVQGRLLEACVIRAVWVANTLDIAANGSDLESLQPLIDQRREEAENLNKQIENLTTAIQMGTGPIASLVMALQRAESEKNSLLLELDKLSQQEAIRNSDDDITNQLLAVARKLTPEVLTDVTHPHRHEVRELVRRLFGKVIVTKRDDKSLSIRVIFPSGVNYLCEGVMKLNNGKKEKSYVEYLTQQDGITPLDTFMNRVRSSFWEMLTDEIAGDFDFQLPSPKPYDSLESTRTMIEAMGHKPLNGKDFFGKR
ncbi:recombinase family protein [Enterobacteriaceae bacterium BIT-l23]|uniref:recombinase family protein n=1 Tax=Jejubacter sp. L23 TaxID=3092086 RepID=UPI001585BE36|nr:recombinase family protein [Enterobacteriaceae bacterium BIT-l23]